ncbi:MAG: cryptochrome/photolyase family protein [Verrucomicrobiaceae bacterium]|nr:cryptochrome/photolyase family protein [Verrucomicrobiaceae bacterium]
MKPIRHLVIVLGDQLNQDSAAFDGFDPRVDAVWMAEVAEESVKVWSVKARIAMFVAAMRHFRDALTARGWRVLYREMAQAEAQSFVEALRASLAQHRPGKVIMVKAGEWQVDQDLRAVCAKKSVELEVREDRHFLCSEEEFEAHTKGRKQLRMEFFYREMRQRTGVLMKQGQPVGGKWNYDAENRGSFGSSGPDLLKPKPKRFAPDAVTRKVIEMVNERFAKHPGALEDFDWPVTPEQADEALADFIEHRLPEFGKYQDAMWTNEPWLYHSRLSAAMNLKLLDPRKVIAAAEQAFHHGKAPLEAVEGFIRQILGWREYVRGVYWKFMPSYVERNAMSAYEPLPDFFWTGKTEMACLRDTIQQTLRYGYAHHIQRLMITGLYCLLLGVDPRRVHEWYLAVYVDAIEWVELPNTLGMSQYADGGVMASKPYIASGKYVQRMSNYCGGCRFKPDKSTGADACPFTTLYWDYLLRHLPLLNKNPRMGMQVKNALRLSEAQRVAIHEQAESIRRQANV